MRCMLFSVFVLLACAGVIYAACEFFVNGVEWLGHRLNLGETATGTVLAALGTALPESAVTLMAVAFGTTAAQKDIGIGAALGGPLVLATISYACVGLVLWWRNRSGSARSSEVKADMPELRRDQLWFVSIFVFKLALGFVWFTGKPWCAVFFLAAYAWYIMQELAPQPGKEARPHAHETLEPLTLCPKKQTPPMGMILLQTLGAVVVIGVASHYFVGALEHVSLGLGMPSHLVALFLSPLATELPETMNALIWVRQGKERLALANISGAMMIQATIPSAFGLMFTSWMFDATLAAAGAVTLLAVMLLWLQFRRPTVKGKHLLPTGLLYGLFVIVAVALN